MNFDLQPILENDLVILRPLRKEDYEVLFKVSSDPLIWEQHPDKTRSTKEGFARFFEESLASKGTLLIQDKRSDKVIGSSRYKIIDLEDGVVEIGWTFLSRDYWGGEYNTSIKKLMINYALDSAKHIIFYVAKNNLRSRIAVEKFGAEIIEDTKISWVANPTSGDVTYRIKSKLK